MGLIHDYPHFYKMTREGQDKPDLFAIRETENGDFIISTQEKVFCKFGPNYVGTVRANMLGTRFEIVNYGISPKALPWGLDQLPPGFFAEERLA